MNHYCSVPRVKVWYKTTLAGFDAVAMHYDDEHRKYHICGGNYNQKSGRIKPFRLGSSYEAFGLTVIRGVFENVIEYEIDPASGKKYPIRWEPCKSGPLSV